MKSNLCYNPLVRYKGARDLLPCSGPPQGIHVHLYLVFSYFIRFCFFNFNLIKLDYTALRFLQCNFLVILSLYKYGGRGEI